MTKKLQAATTVFTRRSAHIHILYVIGIVMTTPSGSAVYICSIMCHIRIKLELVLFVCFWPNIGVNDSVLCHLIV